MSKKQTDKKSTSKSNSKSKQTDSREKDFPKGHFCKYVGKKTGFKGKAEIVGYHMPFPKYNGITIELKNGSKKNVSPNSIKIVKAPKKKAKPAPKKAASTKKEEKK